MSLHMSPPSPAALDRPPRVLSSELAAHTGGRVTVAGWLHRRRLLKSVAFAIVRDRAGLSQIVVAAEPARALLETLSEESVVEVTATVTANETAPGGLELTEPQFTVLSEAEPPPVELFRPTLRAGLPVLLDNAPVTLRHPRRKAAFRLAAAAVAGFRAVLSAEGFTEVHTPRIVGSATESGANVFALDYFGRPAFLAQSPQFYKQTLVGVFERVFEVGPVFRAEPHDTVRHLAQYTSLDVEFGFIESYRDVAAVLVEVVAGMLGAVAESGAFHELGISMPRLPEEVPHIHFADAMEMLGRELGEDLTGEDDLSPAHERRLGEWALREHGSDFLVVSGYPMRKRPFYTAPEPGRPGYSDSFDLLFRGTEMVTGGRRLHRYEDYVAALAARGEGTEPYESYLSVFRHGMPPHGGFAIGLERFTAQLTGAANVREVTLFPRDLHRLTP
ncbi:aspartyl-tRNA synthetase [Stackebrandtia albiflava]|uniref:Aspartate--tRNA(Asp/Asn) ligase n=1 Tax=Stackebrandtia albiflava TaxID=406432 RepID=A0A562UQH8_9ACTN|nr:aspartate--tRNA(Asn) ligase [Stackebrandtia albiflava]TWJ07870.1 aspartyl-tRNA synthetase [Stackebrandtia albiflava]